MKNKVLTAAALLSAASFTACNDMLDTDPRVTDLNQATFPGKPSDVEAENAATYSIMNVLGGQDATSFPMYMWEIMSDNCYGSGGKQDKEVKSLNNLVQCDVDQYEGPFVTLYGGIGRANNQIATIDNVPWTADQMAQRNQLLGEGYFMRGLYTLWLTQMYGDVPLITSTVITPEMEQEVSAEDVIYPQILSDFVSAKNLMSSSQTTHGDGHATKYAAEAFIARAYMFWAGFYKNVADLSTGAGPEITLVAQEGCEGGSLKQSDVIAGLKDIRENGGYKLCEDYRSLWQYSNSLLWDEAHDGVGHSYDYIADMDRNNCFDMPGMGNGNTEEIFQIQFMNASSWNIPNSYYSNNRQYSLYMSTFWGLRNGKSNNNGNRDYTYPFNQGWGQGTPSCNIWDDWTAAESDAANSGANPYEDKRKKASLIDLNNELTAYTYEPDDCEESGYSVKKFNSVCLDACKNNLDTWWTMAPGYTSSSLGNSQQGDNFEDFYLMRYADVLLMLSELTGDVQYMNEVQKRAGIPEVNQTKTYTLEAMQDERRWEFAFEGLRFNDMRRWTGNKPTETSYAPKALQAQGDKMVVCAGDKDNKQPLKHMHDGTSSWAKRYVATNGFLSKPQRQINLMNGKLKQNPGWMPGDVTTYKSLY